MPPEFSLTCDACGQQSWISLDFFAVSGRLEPEGHSGAFLIYYELNKDCGGCGGNMFLRINLYNWQRTPNVEASVELDGIADEQMVAEIIAGVMSNAAKLFEQNCASFHLKEFIATEL